MILPMSRRAVEITPEIMLQAYRVGLFPMAETRGSRHLRWLDPERRGIVPLDGFHVPRSLRKSVRAAAFAVEADRDFAGVIARCAAVGDGREDTWINPEIERSFTALAHQGHAHSIEVRRDDALVGGLYGVVIGRAFFGESMFSTVTDASKVALVHLVARLRLSGFRLLDTQFVTSHLARFGAHEISRADYRVRLAACVEAPSCWMPEPDAADIEAEIGCMSRARSIA